MLGLISAAGDRHDVALLAFVYLNPRARLQESARPERKLALHLKCY